MRILIYGRGWIGVHIYRHFADSTKESCQVAFGWARIENYYDVSVEVNSFKPDVVINAAGKTGVPNIDWCLDHQLETMLSNILGPITLARICSERHVYLVHLSTGCLWNEYKPTWTDGFTETDEARPNSFYSRTKLAGEIIKMYDNVLITRIRLPFNSMPHSRNLFTKLMRIPEGGTLVNEPNSITCVFDFLNVLSQLVKLRATGIYHVVNPGPVRNSEILSMCATKGIINKVPSLTIVDKDEFIRRKITKDGRSNCVLDTTKLEAAGIHMRHSQYALEECLNWYRDCFLR